MDANCASDYCEVNFISGVGTCKCDDNGDCSGKFGLCKVSQHQCVECLNDSDCGFLKDCNPNTNTCF